MQNPSPVITDFRPDNNNSSNKPIIIGVVIAALILIAGSVFFLRPSSILNPTIDRGTYLKLSVTPDNDEDIEAEICADILKKNFASAPFHTVINPSENFIEIKIDSKDPATIKIVTDFLALRAKLSINGVHRKSRILADDVAAKKEIVPGYTALPHHETDSSTGITHKTQILIRTRPELTHKDIKSAWVNPRDYSLINIELTNAGGEKMHNFTSTLTKNIDMIATVLNGEVVNYATLNADTLGKNFVISGIDSREDGVKLVRALQNPLTSTLEIVEQSSF